MDYLTGFQRDILYVIGGIDSPKGLEVKKKLDDYYEDEINHGRLYPNLDELVSKGLIDKGQKDDRTNEYSLTKRGNGNWMPDGNGKMGWLKSEIGFWLDDTISF